MKTRKPERHARRRDRRGDGKLAIKVAVICVVLILYMLCTLQYMRSHWRMRSTDALCKFVLPHDIKLQTPEHAPSTYEQLEPLDIDIPGLFCGSECGKLRVPYAVHVHRGLEHWLRFANTDDDTTHMDWVVRSKHKTNWTRTHLLVFRCTTSYLSGTTTTILSDCDFTQMCERSATQPLHDVYQETPSVTLSSPILGCCLFAMLLVAMYRVQAWLSPGQ